MTAVFASKASMSRNCRFCVPGGETFCQVPPPFVVRRTVPRVPLVQTTRLLTTDSPRNCAVEPVGVSCHEYSCLPPETAIETTATATTPIRSGRRFTTVREANTCSHSSRRDPAHRAVEPRPARIDAFRRAGRQPRDQQVPAEDGHADPAACKVGHPVDPPCIRPQAVREDAAHPLDLPRVEDEQLKRPEPRRRVGLRPERGGVRRRRLPVCDERPAGGALERALRLRDGEVPVGDARRRERERRQRDREELHRAVHPPSTGRTAPVTNGAVARYTTAWATSSGRPKVPVNGWSSGRRARIRSSRCTRRLIGVSISPGQTTLLRMPSPA